MLVPDAEDPEHLVLGEAFVNQDFIHIEDEQDPVILQEIHNTVNYYGNQIIIPGPTDEEEDIEGEEENAPPPPREEEEEDHENHMNPQ